MEIVKLENFADDDRFWKLAEKFIFNERIMENAPAEAQSVIELADIMPPAKICDFGCGLGRHCIAFAQKGFEVTGVDRNSPYLEKAADKVRAANVDVELINADSRVFARPGAFDLAVNLYTSIGYYAKNADNMKILENIHSSLRPGGKAVFEFFSREVFARAFQKRDWVQEGDSFLLEERVVNEDYSKINNRWVFFTPGESIEYQMSLWLYSGLQFKQMLLDAGFKKVTLYGALDGRAYDQMARRLVAVAEK